MIKKIFKYEFEVADEVTLDLPFETDVLSVGTQNFGRICIWALVVPGARLVKRKFVVRGTGHPIDMDGLKFLGTVFDSTFVWHVFEKPAK